MVDEAVDGGETLAAEDGLGVLETRIDQRELVEPATLSANPLRLWFASMAYVLLTALQRIALAHTELQNATCGTIRPRLLKIGAQVTRSVRRIEIAMASACLSAAVFRAVHARLSA